MKMFIEGSPEEINNFLYGGDCDCKDEREDNVGLHLACDSPQINLLNTINEAIAKFLAQQENSRS